MQIKMCIFFTIYSQMDDERELKKNWCIRFTLLHCTKSLLVIVLIHLSCKVNGSSSAAYATVWLRGAALCTLAQQHAYITEHVLGVILCASVYSGVITRLS